MQRGIWPQGMMASSGGLPPLFDYIVCDLKFEKSCKELLHDTYKISASMDFSGIFCLFVLFYEVQDIVIGQGRMVLN